MSSTLPSTPQDNEILVYADGGCRGNPGPAGLGVVMRWDQYERSYSEYLGPATNNIAELTAVLRALQSLPDPTRPVHILTDSQYTIGVLTKNWKAKANVELIATIKDTLAGVGRYAFTHVRGHAGVALNERADALANQAMDTQQSAGWSETRSIG